MAKGTHNEPGPGMSLISERFSGKVYSPPLNTTLDKYVYCATLMFSRTVTMRGSRLQLAYSLGVFLTKPQTDMEGSFGNCAAI